MLKEAGIEVHIHIQLMYLSSPLTRACCRGGPPPREDLTDKKKQELVAALKKADIDVKSSSPVTLNQFYPPFAPRFIRLQELLLPVEDSSE